MKLKIKRLSPSAKLPTYATDGSAAFDLYANTVQGFSTGACAPVAGFPVFCGTGLSFEVPKGWVMLVFSRSGHGFRFGVRLANCVGVIDSDFRGEVMVSLASDGTDQTPALFVAPGDRIAQALLVQAPVVEFDEVSELSETARGAGGLGSTGA